MATPFEQFINDRLVKYLAAEKIEITNNTALGIKRNMEIRRLPIPVEYTDGAQDLSSNRRRGPTASTFRAAAGAASTTSSCSRRISTPPS